MRNFINITESFSDNTVASKIRNGETEGFNPYWKLVADPRVLSDFAAMVLIADLVDVGFTSGIHPTWELIQVDANETEAEIAPDAAIELPAEITDIPAELTEPTDIAPENDFDQLPTDGVVPDEGEELVSSVEYATRDELSAMGDGADTDLGEIVYPEEIGPDNEDEIKEEIEGIRRKNLEDYLADLSAAEDEQLLLDSEDEEGDGTSIEELNRYVGASDLDVELAAIHERGQEQDDALAELDRRGITLTPEQLTIAGK